MANNRTYKRKIEQLTRTFDDLRRTASESSATNFRTIRDQIIWEKCEWGKARARQLSETHTQTQGRSTKTFFRRFSNKYEESWIYASNVNLDDHSKPTAVADALATAWIPVMSGDSSSTTAIDALFQVLEAPVAKPHLKQIDTPILLEEVTHSIRVLNC